MPHPRITQPSPFLPPGVHEVMLVPARGGFTAFVRGVGGAPKLTPIPLIGCQPECEPCLSEALQARHGFNVASAKGTARYLFAELEGDGYAPSSLPSRK